MSEVTQLLSAAQAGDPQAMERLMALVYEDLREMARRKLAKESPGQTLQATALVHEAWLRLGASEGVANLKNRGYFFASFGETMRRILVERARQRHVLREKGGYAHQVDLTESKIWAGPPDEEVLLVDEVLNGLEAENAEAAALTKLRFFVGMTMEEAAEALGMAMRTAERLWTYASAVLRKKFREAGYQSPSSGSGRAS